MWKLPENPTFSKDKIGLTRFAVPFKELFYFFASRCGRDPGTLIASEVLTAGIHFQPKVNTTLPAPSPSTRTGVNAFRRHEILFTDLGEGNQLLLNTDSEPDPVLNSLHICKVKRHFSF